MFWQQNGQVARERRGEPNQPRHSPHLPPNATPKGGSSFLSPVVAFAFSIFFSLLHTSSNISGAVWRGGQQLGASSPRDPDSGREPHSEPPRIVQTQGLRPPAHPALSSSCLLPASSARPILGGRGWPGGGPRKQPAPHLRCQEQRPVGRAPAENPRPGSRT